MAKAKLDFTLDMDYYYNMDYCILPLIFIFELVDSLVQQQDKKKKKKKAIFLLKYLLNSVKIYMNLIS